MGRGGSANVARAAALVPTIGLSGGTPEPRGFSMFTARSMGEGVAWPPYNLHI